MSEVTVASTATLRRLIIVWVSGLSLLAALLLLQTTMNKYGDDTPAAWSWMFAQVVPTLSLALGALIAEEKGGLRRRTSPFMARVAVLGSVAFLLVVVFTLLLEPFAQRDKPFEWLALSTAWLGPLQGALLGALGLFLGRSD